MMGIAGKAGLQLIYSLKSREVSNQLIRHLYKQHN